MNSVLGAQVLDVLLGAGLNRPGVGGGSGVPPSSATTTMRNWPRRHAWIAQKRRPLAWAATQDRSASRHASGRERVDPAGSRRHKCRAGCACRSRPDRGDFDVTVRLGCSQVVTGSGHAVTMHPQGHVSAEPVATRPRRSLSAGAKPPVGRYPRAPVEIHQADPHAAEVARRLIALIAASRPGAMAEHVGSSAVPGLAGKGIIDLLLPTDPVDLTGVTQALVGLGFQLQDPQAFPPTRPMLWGVLRHRSTDYRVHVHVVPSSSPEVAAMRGFRDALRADPDLRHRYAALKRAIVADGPVDPMAFTRAKHDWIAAALGRLGLPAGRRLYQDDPAETADAPGR
jgi:GrpB-like predicted nucleotidyltransferase (UPF0157 family)